MIVEVEAHAEQARELERAAAIANALGAAEHRTVKLDLRPIGGRLRVRDALLGQLPTDEVDRRVVLVEESGL